MVSFAWSPLYLGWPWLGGNKPVAVAVLVGKKGFEGQTVTNEEGRLSGMLKRVPAPIFFVVFLTAPMPWHTLKTIGHVSSC